MNDFKEILRIECCEGGTYYWMFQKIDLAEDTLIDVDWQEDVTIEDIEVRLREFTEEEMRIHAAISRLENGYPVKLVDEY